MRRGYAMSLIDRSPYEAIPLSCQRVLGVLLLEDFRFEEAFEVFEDYARNVAAGPGAETFDGRNARVLAQLARGQMVGMAEHDQVLTAELETLRQDFPERLRDSVLPQHLLAADLMRDRPGALERASAMLAELDGMDGAGRSANVSQLLARAALRGGAREAASVLLADALDRHRALMAPEAPLLAELETLSRRAEGPQMASARQQQPNR